MKRVVLRVRPRSSRVPFGTLVARLEEVDDSGFRIGTVLFAARGRATWTPTVLFTTRGYRTWASAAADALKKADRMRWKVLHRDRVLRRIAAEGKSP